MNYGMHLSASGVLTNMYRQDVFANNLANVGSIGFRYLAAMGAWAATQEEDPRLAGRKVVCAMGDGGLGQYMASF